MAETALIFTLDDGTSKTITLDATLSEGHTSTSTITRHPVEEGADISDHTRPEPDKLTLDGVVSNTPLTSSQVARFNAAGGGRYAEGVEEELRAFKNAGTLCSVATSLRTYTSMVLSSVNTNRNARNSGGVTLSLSLERIEVVKNKLTRTTVAKDRRAQRKVAKGKQTPKDPKRKQSAAFKMAQGLAGTSNETASGLGNFLLSGGQGQGSTTP